MWARFARRAGRVGVLFAAVFPATALAVWLAERDEPGTHVGHFGDALWFCIVTVSTVGYGDVYPVTALGRVVTGLFILFTLVTIGFLVTAISESVLEVRNMEEQGLIGTELRGHTVVVGWSAVSRAAVEELLAAGASVALLCERPEDVATARRLGERDRLFVTAGDPDLAVLRERLNAPAATTAVVATDDDARNIIASLNLRAAAPGLRIIVAVRAEALRQTLIASGVTWVTSPYELSGRLVASAAFEPEVARFVEDVTSGVHGDHDLQQYAAAPLAGRTVREARAELDDMDGPLLVGVARWEDGGYNVIPHPPRDLRLGERDQLLVLADRAQAGRFAERFGARQGR